MPKKQPAAPERPKSIDPGPLVDELGSIEKELAPLKGKIERAKLLRETIRGLTDDKTSEVPGKQFVAILGPRASETVVDYYPLAKKIGLDKYAQIATATLKALGKSVPAGILAQFLKTKQTGTRHLTVIEKGQAA